MLALTHLSTRYPVGVLVEEARELFSSTFVPRDFDTIELPFAERGGPELIRWDARESREQAEALADPPAGTRTSSSPPPPLVR